MGDICRWNLQCEWKWHWDILGRTWRHSHQAGIKVRVHHHQQSGWVWDLYCWHGSHLRDRSLPSESQKRLLISLQLSLWEVPHKGTLDDKVFAKGTKSILSFYFLQNKTCTLQTELQSKPSFQACHLKDKRVYHNNNLEDSLLPQHKFEWGILPIIYPWFKLDISYTVSSAGRRTSIRRGGSKENLKSGY